MLSLECTQTLTLHLKPSSKNNLLTQFTNTITYSMRPTRHTRRKTQPTRDSTYWEGSCSRLLAIHGGYLCNASTHTKR